MYNANRLLEAYEEDMIDKKDFKDRMAETKTSGESLQKEVNRA
ncbi:hypothetical protein [Clostridium beijerinckii]|nr:hypothetical protein [Clostridium beijerinckii]